MAQIKREKSHKEISRMKRAITIVNNMHNHLLRNQLLKLTILVTIFQQEEYHPIPDLTRAHN
jgi:hypothetical protein